MTPLSTLGVEGVKMMGHLWVKNGRKDGQPGVIFHDGDLRIRNAISRESKRRSKFGTEDARSCLAAQLQLDEWSPSRGHAGGSGRHGSRRNEARI